MEFQYSSNPAIIIMPGYISRVEHKCKVSRSSGAKVFDLCLEICDSIPKELQRICKDRLGFRSEVPDTYEKRSRRVRDLDS